MKRFLAGLALASAVLCLPAFAQATLTPPSVPATLPAPVATVAVGGSVTVTWSAITESTTGAALLGPATYNLWGVETGTAVEENSGITLTSITHTGMTAGVKCYEITASVSGDIDSVGSAAVCVNVVVPTPQVSAPTNVAVKVGAPQ